VKYFLDTYAIIEISKANPHYNPYLKQELYTSLSNLYELYYILLRDHNEEIAREFFETFLDNCIPIQPVHIFKAASFKLKHRKNKLSYADSLGYSIALHQGIKFLTGDKQFEEIENVEYVK